MVVHEEEAVQLPCTVLETGLTPADIQELLSLMQSGNEEDETSPSSGSQGSSREVYSNDERKRRRMQLNRESARRSRWRRKRHLENLNTQANSFSIENQQLKNRLGLAMHQLRLVWLENERLRTESVALLARLSDLYLILGSMNSQKALSHINY
ncbi:basic leucine zipper 4-like [Prosopis cineraria]|uniref:basic leucine zipper 4-like n=1 Tax=Prosopis cineraria TaxID=364024 RepID=UPI00240F4C31|nr:basic leucine zipper 4-like [Prosopis cineraria]